MLLIFGVLSSKPFCPKKEISFKLDIYVCCLGFRSLIMIAKWPLNTDQNNRNSSSGLSKGCPRPLNYITGKNNGFPILDILGYLKNTHKNPKFGRVRQIPIREFPTKLPNWDLYLTLPNLGFLRVFFKYPKISPKLGIRYFFLCIEVTA